MAATPWMTARYFNRRGGEETLARYAGGAILLANTASQCGYTPQYAQLQELYDHFGARGLTVLAFPSNDFGAQEPGTDDAIHDFCKVNYGVSFPVMAKMPTRGAGASPLFAALTGPASPFPGEVAWNFEKFLIDTRGALIGRFASDVVPTEPTVLEAIERALA